MTQMHARVARRSILLRLKSRLVNSLQVFAKIIKYQQVRKIQEPLQQYYFCRFFPPIGLHICFTLCYFMILRFLYFNILFHIELYRLGPSPISRTDIVFFFLLFA